MRYELGQLVAAATFVLVSLAAASNCGERRLLDSSNVLAGVAIPASLVVPSGNGLHLAFQGVGHQHYTFNGSQWVLQNATANLYTIPDNELFGQHFFLKEKDANGGQPSWESYGQESLVTAKASAAVTVDVNSITWNLLEETSRSGSKELLGDVTYVQRLQTKAGLAPSTTTGSAQNGDTYASSYSAIYAFYLADSDESTSM